MPIPILRPHLEVRRGTVCTRPPSSHVGSVSRLSFGREVLKVSHDLVVYPSDPVVAEPDPFGPFSGILQSKDMLARIGLHGLQNFPIDDPHRKYSRKREHRDARG